MVWPFLFYSSNIIYKILLYAPIFLRFPFFLLLPAAPFAIFFCLKNLLSQPQGWEHDFRFPSSENVFIPSSFLQGGFARIRTHSYSYLSSWTVLWPLRVVARVPDEHFSVLPTGVLLQVTVPLLWADLKMCFFPISFQNLNCDVLWRGFLVL